MQSAFDLSSYADFAISVPGIDGPGAPKQRCPKAKRTLARTTETRLDNSLRIVCCKRRCTTVSAKILSDLSFSVKFERDRQGQRSINTARREFVEGAVELFHVRFTPESGHRQTYSITSSARPISVLGTFRPSALAVLRLITSSNFVAA
jgi:hypothetical protein